MNNKDHPCETCKHRRNCINGMYCTLRQAYVEYVNTGSCEHYDIDMDRTTPHKGS